jgi:hypothetical protein
MLWLLWLPVVVILGWREFGVFLGLFVLFVVYGVLNYIDYLLEKLNEQQVHRLINSVTDKDSVNRVNVLTTLAKQSLEKERRRVGVAKDPSQLSEKIGEIWSPKRVEEFPQWREKFAEVLSQIIIKDNDAAVRCLAAEILVKYANDNGSHRLKDFAINALITAAIESSDKKVIHLALSIPRGHQLLECRKNGHNWRSNGSYDHKCTRCSETRKHSLWTPDIGSPSYKKCASCGYSSDSGDHWRWS